MKVTIPFHSVVDVITNSSTVIFTWAASSAESMVRDLVNEILQKAGSDRVFEDLYTVKVVLYPGSLESALDSVLEQAEDPDERDADARLQALYDIDNADYPADDWKTRYDALLEYMADNYSPDELDNHHNYYDFPLETGIVIESIDGSDSNVDNILSNLFTHDAIRDG